MTILVHCPECGKEFTLDGRSAGGEMICSNCMARIYVPRARGAKAVAPPPAPVAQPATPRPPVEGSATREPRLDAEAEVICPRCKLHFAPRPEHAAPVATARRTVLLAEDQAPFREIALDALRPRFDVRVAESAAEARAALARGGIDLLVLDPTLDGGEGGLRLLTDLRPKPCPVLLFSAADESDLYGSHWDELRQAGADDLVLKSVNAAESLARKASRLLGEAPE